MEHNLNWALALGLLAPNGAITTLSLIEIKSHRRKPENQSQTKPKNPKWKENLELSLINHGPLLKYSYILDANWLE